MSFQKSTTDGRHSRREGGSSRHNKPYSANSQPSSQRPIPGSWDIPSAAGQSGHSRPPPPPSDSRLRLINERPPGFPRHYLTSYQIQQYLLEDYDTPLMCFYHLVDALDAALRHIPCPVSFDIKAEHLPRLEAKWCQDISAILHRIMDPGTLEFLESKFTKEMGYFIFCLAQNCWDVIPDPESSSATGTQARDGSPQRPTGAKEYVLLDHDDTHNTGTYTTFRIGFIPREPHITSSGGRSRAYFDTSAPRREKDYKKTFDDCDWSIPSTTTASTEAEDKNYHNDRDNVGDRNHQVEKHDEPTNIFGITETQVWLIIFMVIGLGVAYVYDSWLN
ncbi:hypothetical protein TWF506_005435 [Arthrobotrys conoides]|uniref:Uncharacterized protein n=1 Tax=Arthrobotrys conoides TaxID=74498 RepID=A0AAN8RW07_9PEZI